MIDKINNIDDNRLCYRSPKVNVFKVKIQSVLCQSLGYPTEFEEENDN